MIRRVAIISFTPAARAPRVMRQVRLLEHDCDVTVIGFGDRPPGNIRWVPLSPPKPSGLVRHLPGGLRAVLRRLIGKLDPRLWPDHIRHLSGRFERIYWSRPDVRRTLEATAGMAFDLVIPHDVRVLPVGLRVANGARVLYDAHEYAPRQYEEEWWWRMTTGRLFTYLCKTYLPRVDGMVTVGEGIADEYRRVFGVASKVICNSPVYQDLAPSPVVPGRFRMVHHGGATPGRRIETFIEAMAHLDDRYSLDLILVGASEYIESLKRLAAGDDRIRFPEPVPMPEICRNINAYDIGLFCIPPVSFNQVNCRPNKVFEYVQARLAIVSGPTREVRGMIESHGLGVVSASFAAEDFAAAIRSVTPEALQRYKAAAHVAARELSFERDAEVLRAEVERLLAR